MLHYVDAIRSRGTADNFNTEQSERLHIEFAKKGYRASNWCEYTKQMVLWLQQQESTISFDGYLNWAAPNFMLTALDALSDTDKEISPSIAPIRTSINDKIAVRYDAMCYYLPKSPPQSGIDVDDILSDFGTTQFVSAIEEYMQSTTGSYDLKPRSSDHYDVYTQFKISYPDCNILGSCLKLQPLMECIHAHPGTSGSSSPQFDTVLVWTHRQEGLFGTVHSEYCKIP
jgi:hypothetical protein